MQKQTNLHQPAKTPLSEHGVLRSNSFDEAQSFLRNKNLEIQPTRAGSLSNGFNAAIDAAYLPRMYLAYMEYSAELEMTALAPLETDYGVHLPLGGNIELRNGNHILQCAAGRTAVVSPANRVGATMSGDCKRLLINISCDALTKHLATMIGDLPDERLLFVHDAAPSEAHSRRLANAVAYAAREFERKDSIDGNDIVVTQFEQFIMTLLLMSQPNNYSEALNRPDNGVRPKDVKRAIDYIHANLGNAITLEDLVAAAQVPGRTLYQHFQDFVGATPMGYIKRARYERVHDDLAQRSDHNTVTEIAGHWGFNHMGRFAAEYRHRFGELPSVTARKRRPPKD